MPVYLHSRARTAITAAIKLQPLKNLAFQSELSISDSPGTARASVPTGNAELRLCGLFSVSPACRWPLLHEPVPTVQA